MTFAPGDRVHVAGLGTGVVRDTRNGGRYVIEIKGRLMTIPGDRLEAASAPTPPPRRERRADAPPPASPPDTRRVVSVDLHGNTVATAVEALDRFLNDALLEGRQQVHVIHGRGAGHLQRAVHARLAQLACVSGFRLDPRNPGVTIVSL